jgi:hypothetical protein
MCEHSLESKDCTLKLIKKESTCKEKVYKCRVCGGKFWFVKIDDMWVES